MATYNQFVTDLANLMAQEDIIFAPFVAMVPDAIAYAEGRMYRELDMLGIRIVDNSVSTTLGQSTVDLPANIAIVDALSVVSPAGSAVGVGTLVPLVPTTRNYLDAVWGSPAVTGTPAQFAPVYQTASTNKVTVVLGPIPDGAYALQVTGTQAIPTPLSSSNQTTPLTTWLYETFLTCAMIFASGYQKAFGAQSAAPEQAVSWETQYQTLMGSAGVWERRKSMQAAGWSARAPDPVVKAA